METPLRSNAFEAPFSLQALPIIITTSDMPIALKENRLDPPSPTLPYSQTQEGIESLVKPSTSLFPINFKPLQLKKFSNTTYCFTPLRNRKRGVPALPLDPLS